MGARVIGIGRTTAGDDGVGIAVVRLLEHMDKRPSGLELYQLADPVHIVDLVCTPYPVVIVDAVAGAGPPGRVLLLGGDDLATAPRGRFDVASAVRLAATLAPDTVSRRVSVVAVTIESAEHGRLGLTRSVEDAVPLAAELIIGLLRAEEDGSPLPYEK